MYPARRIVAVLVGVGVLASLAGCASTSPGATARVPAAHDGSRVANLQRADGASGVWQGVRYDRATGTCSNGVTPLMDVETFERRSEDGRLAAGCTGVAIAEMPGSTGYPAAMAQAGVAGSAQVLVLVDSAGRAVEAHAVCASVPEFAAPAVATALAIRYRPARCDGADQRAAALVPFAYAP